VLLINLVNQISWCGYDINEIADKILHHYIKQRTLMIFNQNVKVALATNVSGNHKTSGCVPY
jgi:hypothetical protein